LQCFAPNMLLKVNSMIKTIPKDIRQLYVRVAACCSVLQCVALCCSVLHHEPDDYETIPKDIRQLYVHMGWLRLVGSLKT